MAKGKNLNPADALRKAQRKKELKKNKVERQKNREFALVKKDTTVIEDEIDELQRLTEPSATQKARLSELRSELDNIKKKKDEYVQEHPEHRNLVYASARRREQRERGKAQEKTSDVSIKKERNLFNKNGLPRHPERSVYYDPVLNPYGMPPPGMPYVERPLYPGEVDSEAEPEEIEGDSDDDIPIPEGPPPGVSGSGVDSDDDIPMPEGPPPIRTEEVVSPFLPPLPPGPPPLQPPFLAQSPQYIAPGPSSNSQMLFLPPPPPFPQALPGTVLSHPVPPFPPQGFPPPPPPGFGLPNLPHPPPGFYPRRNQTTSSMQDPLSSVPHQTFQAHKQLQHSQGVSPNSSLPNNPNLPSRPTLPAGSSSAEATVTAEPELRDFKKESTAFVPSAVKRKKAGAGNGQRINAAPSLGPEASSTKGSTPTRPDLLGTLREKLGPMPAINGDIPTSPATNPSKDAGVRAKGRDDYDKFLEEMGDLLEP